MCGMDTIFQTTVKLSTSSSRDFRELEAIVIMNLFEVFYSLLQSDIPGIRKVNEKMYECNENPKPHDTC